MFRNFLLTVMVIAAAIMPVPVISASPPSFLALCYHNVEDQDPDQAYVGVSTARLVEQLSWLQSNGYHFISVDDILAAHDGLRALPDKAVLLTFDDGYASFYTRVFPVLKAFKIPAVIGLVGTWMNKGKDTQVRYGNDRVSGKGFLTWQQIREMKRSGLIEVAAHSNAQHLNILANPQKNFEPSMVTQHFDQLSDSYESEVLYEKRIKDDMRTIARTIEREVGKRPRVMIWPYGEYNDFAASIAAADGMSITFTLQDGFATLDKLRAAPRYLVNANPAIGDFVSAMRAMSIPHPVRVVQISLDSVYDRNPVRQEKNLDALVERIYRMQINTVFLQAFVVPGKDGFVQQVYFPNRHLPMRADLLNRVSWQLRTRAKVQVFASIPILAFDFGKPDYDRRKILEIYEDMARIAPFEGLLFDDDTVQAGSDLEPIREFIKELTARVRRYRAPLITAHTIHLCKLSNSENEELFAKLESDLRTYDYTVVQETCSGVNKNEQWLQDAVKLVATRPDGLKHSIFELQAVDSEGRISSDVIARQMRYLMRAGAQNFGYTPDDFATNHPNASELHKDFSLQSYSYLP